MALRQYEHQNNSKQSSCAIRPIIPTRTAIPKLIAAPNANHCTDNDLRKLRNYQLSDYILRFIVAKVIKGSRGENTRAIILETALRLFRERGFEETTMRLIADEASVSLGNAYYYFHSKDELVHDFYSRLQESQLAACEGILATEKGLKNRLSGVIRAHLAVASPYQRLFISLFKIAADPENELSPFSRETAPVREQCIARFAEMIDGAQEKISPDLRAELPYLLWLYHCGIVLFWIYDKSPSFVRTYRLLELSSNIITNLIGIASIPIMTPARRSILGMIQSLKSV